MGFNKNSNDMGEKIDQILERFYKKEIDLLEVRKELLILFSVSQQRELLRDFNDKLAAYKHYFLPATDKDIDWYLTQ